MKSVLPLSAADPSVSPQRGPNPGHGGHRCPPPGRPLRRALPALLALALLTPGLARGEAAGRVTLEAHPAGRALAPAPGAAGVAALDCSSEPPGTDACVILRCDPCELSIPDEGFRAVNLDLFPGALEELTGSSNCTILDLDAAVELRHSFVGDVALDLTRPGVLNTTLYSPEPACDATVVDARFDDEAAAAADACPADGGLARRPSQPLAAFDGLPAAGAFQLRARDRLFGETGTLSRWGYALAVSCSAGPPPPSCAPTETELCLSGGRFRVTTTFVDPQGIEGRGRGLSLSGDTGYFWFFAETNVELVVKVLDACSFSDHFWVFAGGLTNVEVELTVEDTLTRTVKRYLSSQGVAFQPIQDTAAFATCP